MAELQLLGAPLLYGSYTVDFQRALTGQDVEPLQAISLAGVSTSTVRNGSVGDWVTDPAVLTGVQAGQTHTITGLNPLTSYEMRWVAMGYEEDIDGKTPGDSTIFATTEIEVDALIRNVGETDFIGEHIHNLDGTDQTKQQWMMTGNTAEYEVLIKNRAPVSQGGIKITGPGSDDKWDVAYFDEQGNNLTHMITGTGWNIASLNAGASRVITVEVAPNTAASDGAVKEVLVQATIVDDEVQADAVLATTTAASQMIAKLQYSLDEDITWVDVPQFGEANYPLTVDQYSFVDFRAIKANPNAEWPDGKPVWSGEYWSDEVGETSWEYFEEESVDDNDLKVVTAECGNTLHAEVRVRAAQLSVTSSKDSICAGGISSPIHQTVVTATLRDGYGQPISGRIITFGVENTDPAAPADELGTLSATTAVTNAQGGASTTLTSSQVLGASNRVKATMEAIEEKTQIITADDMSGNLTFNPEELPADGNSTSDVQLALTFEDQPVSGHQINWRISGVWDEAGNPVANPGPEYGSLSPAQSTTGVDGLAHTTYRVGTMGGTIEIEAIDNSVWDNSDDTSSMTMASSTMESTTSQSAASTSRTRRRYKTRTRSSASSAASIEFSEVSVASGFDNTTVPSWLVVPQGGTNRVNMTVRPGSQYNALRYEMNQAVARAQIQMSPTGLGTATITGYQKGETTFNVRSTVDGKVAGRLNVSVKPRRIIKVNFFLVSDSAAHRTPVTRDQVAQILAAANAYWIPQANVEFVTNAIIDDPKKKNLAEPDGTIDPVKQFNFFYNSLRLPPGVSPAPRNVFLVWNTSARAKGLAAANGQGYVGLPPPLDNRYSWGGNFAHELGHTFGLYATGGINGEHSQRPSDVMHAIPGQYIRKSEVDKAHSHR